MVDFTTKLVVSVSGQSGEAPSEASMKDMAAGGTSLNGKFTGNFDGVIGAATPAPATFTIVAGSVANSLTAGTTHSLVGATPLTAQINFLSTVANISDAAALPAATAAMVGAVIDVFNNGAHPAAIWPQAADAIDGGSAGVAVTLTNAKRCRYYYEAVNVIVSAQLGIASA